MSRRATILALAASLAAGTTGAAAAPPSVFFGERAQRAVDRAWAEGEAARKGEAKEKADARREKALSEKAEKADTPDPVTLTGLLYLGQGAWSVWLNGKRYTPEKAPGRFRVVAVTRDWAELVLMGDDGTVQHHFRLRPRQTYMPGRKTVRYGPPPGDADRAGDKAGDGDAAKNAGGESESGGEQAGETAKAPALPETLSPEMRRALERARGVSGAKKESFRVEPRGEGG